MIIKKMILEGDWVEAHLYFDFLWLIGRDGDISAFDLEGFIDARLNGEASAARRLFARNDLLPRVDGSMTASALNKDVRDLLAGTEPIRVSSTDVERHSFHFARQEELSNALDVRFYYGRAFVSVPAALVQFDASGRDALSDGSRRGVVRNSQLGSARVFDEGTPLQVHCRYGAVSLSCGAEGGWYALGALSDDRSWRVDASRFARTSFASEVLAGALGNVGQEEVLDLFQTQARPALRSPRRNVGDQSVEALEVTSVDPEPDPLAKNREQAFRRQTRTEVEQTFLTSTKAFYLLSDGSMRMLALSRDNALLHGTPKPMRYPAPEGRVVGTTTTAGRIVVETDDDIQILDRNRWTTIFEEPVYRVRGYPASRWYKQLLSIVARGRTELLFICDE